MTDAQTAIAPATTGARAVAGLAQPHARQFLTFTLGHQDYAIEILKVQEIRGYSAITPIPNSPGWMKGVMNLRGTVVPVVGLREKFGLDPMDYTKFTVIIVVTVGKRVVGVVVDGVSDVLDLPASSIEPPPELGSAVDTSFMTGIANQADQLIALLDIEAALGAHDLGLMAA